MSFGIGAYKVGGAGQCSSMRRRYPWQLCKRPPPNRDLLGAWKRRGQRTGVKWNLRCIEKQTHLPNESSWQWEQHQKLQGKPQAIIFGAKLDRSVEGAVDNQWQGHTMSSIHTYIYILYLSCRSVKKEAAKELMWTYKLKSIYKKKSN